MEAQTELINELHNGGVYQRHFARLKDDNYADESITIYEDMDEK